MSQSELENAARLIEKRDKNKNGTIELAEILPPKEVNAPAAKGERLPEKLKVGDIAWDGAATSRQIETARLLVTDEPAGPANTAPTLHTTPRPALTAILEDSRSPRGVAVASLLGSSVVDPDTGAVSGVAITGLTFLGLQAMIDPPRPEAISAVRACQSAGIRVKMITGDHAGTAVAIADRLGLNGAGTDGHPAITGRELSRYSNEELVTVAERAAVFARVAPEQKLRLVRAIQARGHIVAMTSDGVNDAPALKQADIGVAMGKEGTDVAREAADIVLTDDNLASIKAAVEEGRGVFDNLTKFIVWTLPTNGGRRCSSSWPSSSGGLFPSLWFRFSGST